MPLAGAAKSAEGRTDFLRGCVENGRFVPAANQSSGAVTSFASAEALAVVPPGRAHVQEGDVLRVFRIADIA
jgi:molybdopterin molybdotransferase